jgi:regulatory protein
MARRDQQPAPRREGDSARAAALRMLGRRDLTRAEIASRLAERGFGVSDIESALDRLVSDRLIDDRRTAASHVRLASQIKGRGPLRIRRELEARGIAAEVVKAAVDEISPDDDIRAIRAYLERKRVPARPLPGERRRIFEQLLRRGFPAAAITKVLRLSGAEEPE